MIRLTIDISSSGVLYFNAKRVTLKDLERADMLWLSTVKKGLIVDGVRITKITVKQMERKKGGKT